MISAAGAGTMGVWRSGQNPEPSPGQEIGFTGWLGLLRALYEVTAEPGEATRPGP